MSDREPVSLIDPFGGPSVFDDNPDDYDVSADPDWADLAPADPRAALRDSLMRE